MHNLILIGRKIISIICLPALGFILYFFYIYFQIGLPCIFHKITGLYCPGCGITRAIISLIKLDFIQAFRYNALGVIFLPIVLFYVQYQLICWGFQRENKIIKKIPNTILYGILILFLFYGVLRNIDLFSFLAPTEIS